MMPPVLALVGTALFLLALVARVASYRYKVQLAGPGEPVVIISDSGTFYTLLAWAFGEPVGSFSHALQKCSLSLKF